MEDNQNLNILEEAVNLAKTLDRSNIKWAFIGGVAVGIHGYIRATEDIDIIIAPERFSHFINNRIGGKFGENKIYVISKEDLIAMKKNSGRKQDLLDVEKLDNINEQ